MAELAGADLDVLVGGLSAAPRAVLDDPRVRSLMVVEVLDEVIGWYRTGCCPASAG